MNKKMLWLIITFIMITVAIAPAAACCCRVTGGGQIRDADDSVVWASYGFVGQPFKDKGTPFYDGQWNHVDHLTGAHFHAPVEILWCEYDSTVAGPDVPKIEGLQIANSAHLGGETGKLTNADGVFEDCEWAVEIWDVNEPGIHRDGYKIDVWCRDEDEDIIGELHNQATEDACIQGPITGPVGSGEPLGIGHAPIGCVHSGNIQLHPTNRGHPCI